MDNIFENAKEVVGIKDFDIFKKISSHIKSM